MGDAATQQPPAGRRRAAPRMVAAFALFVLTATLFCVIAGFVLVRQADDRQEIDRRVALTVAIENLRGAGQDVAALDAGRLHALERIAGLKDLRFEREPTAGNREIQPVLDRQSRIVGWFSWEPDRSMTQAMERLRPLLAVTGLCLIAFAGVALWLVNKAMRALARSERLAWSLAHEDMLTGLPSHRKMVELIDAALAARGPAEVVTLAFIDLDGLNDVNDAYGHGTGDSLLVTWAARLKDLSPPGAACRFDGDTFALVTTAEDSDAAEAALRSVADGMSRPFWVNDQAIQVGATLGLAHAPIHARSRDELARCADLALRWAKRKNRGGIAGFARAMDVEFDDRRFLERELRRALADDALDMHYQPVVTADGARIVGAEALLRWQHPVRGAIPPAEFVKVAEQAGLMGRLGEFVLRRALDDARRWPTLSIAINLSPVQVRDRMLVDLVATLLAENRIAPSRVVLEVTESVMIDNPDEAKARLEALRALGVRLALDDFGTGYSSLTYLQRLRFDKLKIDKGFVDPLGRAPESQSMVQAIVTLARALGLRTLAEGVETEEQRVLLRLAGCDEMQGYLFARPGPREALDRLVAEAGGSRSAARAAAV